MHDDSIILKVEVGSGAYGTGEPGQEDIDHMAIGVESLDVIFGLKRWDKGKSIRPGRGPEDPSGPGDLDLIIHPLKQWMSLALKCNASIMMALWCPPITITPAGELLRAEPERYLSKQLFDRYIGYARGQIINMETGKHNRSRKHIVERCGYDAKSAMHALRLVMQGRELAETGRVEIPIPSPRGDLLRAIRVGELSKDQFMNVFEKELDTLIKVEANSKLSEDPDYDWATETLRDIYFEYFGLTREGILS